MEYDIVTVYLGLAYAIGIMLMFQIDDFKTYRSKIMNVLYPIAVIIVAVLTLFKKQHTFFNWLDK